MGRISNLKLSNVCPGHREEDPASLFNPAEADRKRFDSQKFSVKEGVYMCLLVLLPAAPGRCQNLVEKVFADPYQQFNGVGDSVLL